MLEQDQKKFLRMPYILSVAKEANIVEKKINKNFDFVDTKEKGFNIKKMY